jgi:hypothetical protein
MTTDSERAWPAGPRLALLLALVVAALIPLLMTDAPQDDSYITYRYAQNFANGDGFVFNVGEEPVEGYTNFLWTLIIGMGIRLGLDPEVLATNLGLACTILAALVTALLARRLGAGPWLAALAALLFATRPGLTVHAMGGLETPLFALLLLCGVYGRTRAERRAGDDLLSGLCLALAALTRPEGMLLFGLLELADAAWALRVRQAPAAWLAGVARRALPFLLIVGTHLLWRHQTYGDWVPNTFYAKVAGGRAVWMHGYGYSLDAIFAFGLFLFVLPYLVAGEATGRAARLTCLWISTMYLVYVGYVGGDYIPGFRFLLPVMPLWCALAASSMGRIGHRLGGARGPLLAGVALVLLAGFATAREHATHGFWKNQGKRHRESVAAGKKLNEILPPDAWIAATAAGRVPYFAQRRCIDMMGLSDVTIARQPAKVGDTLELAGHLKGDGAYVLGRQPDVIVFLRLFVQGAPLARSPNWPSLTRNQAFSISEHEIVALPRFRDEYRLYSLPLTSVGAWLNVFARQGTLDPAMLPGLIEADWPADR